MHHVPHFKYPPLNSPHEIRVVKLERGLWNDPVRCQLANVDLTAKFEAVSYEWGPRGEQECIFLNDTPFMVRKNLHEALRHFRRSSLDRVLWVDALCINQKDSKEKSQQIPLMGKIYGRSWDTLVWLGPARDDSDLAISYLEHIGLNNYDASLAIIRNRGEPNERAIRAILALCNRTYWQRAWVVQEIRFASQITLFCGEKTIAGETFMLACKTIQHAYNDKFPHLLQQIGESLASNIMDCSNFQDLRLKDWLIVTRQCISSVPGDKVRALINLGTDCRGSLKLDFSSSVTVSQVYEEVLRECSVNKESGKPVYDVFDLSQELQWALGVQSESVQLTDEDNKHVWICGVISAQITSFQDDQRIAWSHKLYPKNIVEGDSSFWSTKSNTCILNPDAGKRMEIIQRRRYSDAKALAEVIKDIMINLSLPTIQSDKALVELQDSCRKLRLKDSQHRGKPFRCSGQNCSGFAPTGAEIGDRICRFPGSRVGLVFRQALDGSDRCRLVGRAITDRRFKISEKDIKNFWPGDPEDSEHVAFGCDDAWYLKMSMVTLQRLTAD